MSKHRLDEKDFRVSDRMVAWLLTIFGYTIALAMATDSSGWDDPVFGVVHKLPYTPYSWAAILGFGVSVYAAGEFANSKRRWRGRVVITGASLCMFWAVGMSLLMSRMVYEMPERITDMWPIVMFFIASLYATRIIVYANTFTGKRWTTNPYQLWDTLFLMIVSTSQMVIGVAPNSIFVEVDRPIMFQLAAVNFIGAAVVMFGLHMRNKELGMNLELAGAFSLVVTLSWYCVNVLHAQTLAGTTLGFGLAEAFIFGTLHRGIQILTLKLARRQGKWGLARRTERALQPRQQQQQERV